MALVEPHHGGGDLAHLRGDMADIDHRDCRFIAQAHEIRQDFALVAGIERGERLVEQQKTGPHQQGAADGDALTLAAGQHARPALEQVSDAQQRRDPFEFCRIARPAAHTPAIVQVLPHTQMRKQAAFLKHITDLTPVRRHIDRLCGIEQGRLVEHNAAAIRFEEPGDHIDQRGFAGARRAKQGGDATGDLESHRKRERTELFFHLEREHDYSP